MHRIAIALIAGGMSIMAQQSSIQVLPKMTAELRAMFWRTQAEAILAENEARRKRAIADATAVQAQQLCGPEQVFAMHQSADPKDPMNGEVECQPKPEKK